MPNSNRTFSDSTGLRSTALPVLPERIANEQLIGSPTTFLVLPRRFINALIGTTPDVNNYTHCLSHAVPTTVTDFKKGQNGQSLNILGNGNTTISNNASIKTNTGANKLLAADKVYRFTFFTIAPATIGVWYEDA